MLLQAGEGDEMVPHVEGKLMTRLVPTPVGWGGEASQMTEVLRRRPLVQLAPLESLHEKNQGESQGVRTREGKVLGAKGGREDLLFCRNRGSRAVDVVVSGEQIRQP